MATLITESMDLLARARELWLSPDADMQEVERLYRMVLADKEIAHPHVTSDNAFAVGYERLALILCQSGRSKEVSSILGSLGYTCRLSSLVLDYPSMLDSSTLPTTTKQQSKVKPPCRILDNFLTSDELKILQDVFLDTDASYWVDHNYQVEPPSPYFSYIIPLSKASDDFGFIGHVVLKCLHHLKSKFPHLNKATTVEMWAHNRPHASGHQMHFDSDNEGMGGVRNPVISTILFLTDGTGGPSLVTNQKLAHGQLATMGWLSSSKEKRLVAFDGQVLHGVVPGKGCSGPGRRVTLMFAFWKKIKVREGGGAAKAFSNDNAAWAVSLKRDYSVDTEHDETPGPTEVEPFEVKPIYESLNGEAWSRDMGFPEYDKVFQGF
jgi:hypothetical protein